MKYGASLPSAAKIELMNELMRILGLSPAEVIDLLDLDQKEWDSWLKAQNSKLVKVLK